MAILEPTDADLMQRVRSGSAEALDDLYVRYHRRLYTFCHRLTGSRDAAEDVVQEVFLRILRYRKTFRPDSSFAMWAFTIARNAAARYRDRERRFVPLPEPEEIPGSGRDPIEGMDRNLRLDVLERALATLDPDTRALLLLARFEGRKYSEIARHFRVTEGAIKVRVFRALKRLRDACHVIARERHHGLS